jgi:hypothetical protein
MTMLEFKSRLGKICAGIIAEEKIKVAAGK